MLICGQKKRSRLCVEYWVSKGYTEEDAKIEISNIQRGFSNKYVTWAREHPDEYSKKNVKNVNCWLSRGYSEKQAKKIISESQKTFTLEKCIEKYGEYEGKKRWEKRQKKWQESLNKSGFHQLGFSKVSQELFDSILKTYNEDEIDYVFYQTKNREYALQNDAGYYYRYDFCDLNKRKFIEFNGDIYHGNPKMFKETDKPNPFRDSTAKELWEVDLDKENVAKRNGFSQLVVWESDYRENKKRVLEECLKFLNDGQITFK